MRELHVDQSSTAEVYAQRNAMPEQHGKHSRHAEHQRKGEKIPLLAEKVDVGLFKEFHAVVKSLPSLCGAGQIPAVRSLRLNAQSLAALLAAQDPVTNHARDKHHGKQVG